MYYLNACCLIHILLCNQKYMARQLITRLNLFFGCFLDVLAFKEPAKTVYHSFYTEFFSVMTVSVNGFHNDVMTCMFQIG